MTATGYVASGDLTRVAKAGDTMSGPLILSGDPVTPLGAATEQFVLTHSGTGSVKTVNNVSPDASGNLTLTPSNIGALAAASNLSDLTSAAAARTSLGLGSAATQATSAFLQPGNNLSDVASAAAARSNLGLGSAATQPTSAFLQPSSNLSDVASAGSARTNLGLGTAAVVSLNSLLQVSNNLSDVASVATARTNLGLGSASTLASSALLLSANNLSDLTSAGTARVNLGLGSAATLASSAVLLSANNLSDVSSAGSARSNLGLTVLATSSFSILATDYQPIGLAATGILPTAARADHVHPYWPWQFPVTNYGAKGTGLIDNTAAMSSGSNVININTSRFSSATDIGKLIMLKDAVTTQFVVGQSTATGTITAVNSPTQVVASFSAAVAVSSGLLMWADDDTTAFQSAWNNAVAYASAHGYAEVVVPVPSAGLYWGIGPTLQTTDGTNAVFNSSVYIPIVPERSLGLNVSMKGEGDSGWTRYWSTDYPVINASTIVGFGLFATAGAQSSSISTRGNPAVFGGPTGKFGYGNGTPQPLYSNIGVDFENITILTPHSTAGFTYGVGNFYGIARFGARNFTYGTTGLVQIYNSNSGDFNNVSLLATGLSIGLLLPSNGNNARNYLNNVYCNGGYTFGLVAMEHTVANGLTILYCWSGLCPCGNYTDSGSAAVAALHASWYDQVCIEACTYHVNIFGAGSAGIGPIIHGTLDTEGTIQIRDNPNNGTGLAAARGELRLAGSPSTVTTTFPTGLRIIKEQNLPGVAAGPSLVANTAILNNLWRPATVYLKGGTGLTTIQVSNLAGGSSATMSNVADLTSAGTISTSGAPFPVRVGPGQWLQVNITGAGSALPSAVWVLD